MRRLLFPNDSTRDPCYIGNDKAHLIFDSYRMCAKFLGMQRQERQSGQDGAPEAVSADAGTRVAAGTLAINPFAYKL